MKGHVGCRKSNALGFDGGGDDLRKFFDGCCASIGCWISPGVRRCVVALVRMSERAGVLTRRTQLPSEPPEGQRNQVRDVIEHALSAV